MKCFIFKILALIIVGLFAIPHTVQAQSLTTDQKPAPAGCYYEPVVCIQAPCPPQLICPTPKPTPSITSTKTKPIATPLNTAVKCESLSVKSGNGSNIPASVVLSTRVAGDEKQVNKYRFYFGDGTQTDSDKPEISHKYEIAGKFIARVDIQDKSGKWLSSNSCETAVEVKTSSIESHKANCSDLFITHKDDDVVPSEVVFNISGYDNKGEIKKYRLDFGNGSQKESDNRQFEHTYDKAGSYTARAYIQNSQGNWMGGEENCKKTLTIVPPNQAPLTKQPETGAPTLFLVTSLVSLGLSGLGLKKLRHS